MSSRIRVRDGLKQIVQNDCETGSAEDDGCCCCFKSKSRSKRKPKDANTNGTYHNNTTAMEHIPKGQAREGNLKEHINGSFVPAVKNSEGLELSRDQQRQSKDKTYMEFDHTKVAEDGAEYGFKQTQPYDLDQENSYGKIKNNGKYTAPNSAYVPSSPLEEKQRSDVWREEDNGSHGGTSYGLTKDKGKGDNGSHGGTRSDPTKKAISSTVEHADPPPWEQKEKVSSTFEQVGPPPRKEKEKVIGSTVEQADPSPRKEQKESNLPEHSYEDQFKGQHKDMHKREYNQENNKNTWPELTERQ